VDGKVANRTGIPSCRAGSGSSLCHSDSRLGGLTGSKRSSQDGGGSKEHESRGTSSHCVG
jgi:hypothetical protein